MSSNVANDALLKIDFVRGEGCMLYDSKGREYIDFLGGWCVSTVGWGAAEIQKAIRAQADAGFYAPPYFTSSGQEALAKTLVDAAPGKLSRVFRCTSGSEAVEFGIKCARAATGKPVIVSIEGVYHGHTYGAAAVGDACHRSMEPCLEGFLKLPMPKTVAEGRDVAAEFEKLVSKRGDVAAFLSEPVWTNAGCFIPPDGFYAAIQDICRRHGVLLVMDEVATGAGRCGRFFASELWGLTPDIITMGKGLTGGYASMGATLVTEKVYAGSRSIPDYSTFGWLAQDLAAAAANVAQVQSTHLPERSAEVGKYLLEMLKPLEKLMKVKEVRGIGMVFGIELQLPIAPLVVLACYRKGLTMSEADSRTLFFSPPLVLDRKLAEQGAKILSGVLGKRD